MRALVIGFVWIAISGVVAGYLALEARGTERRLLLPGDTTSAHYQIADRCELCHTGDGEVAQTACTGCHADQLWQMDNSHPTARFLDPRNFAQVAALDARACITCHVEHQPEMTTAGAVTRPRNLCAACHADIASERPSHRDLAFSSCQNVGCHNFHDNRALSADFLRAHAGDGDLLPDPRVPERTMVASINKRAASWATMYAYIKSPEPARKTMYTYIKSPGPDRETMYTYIIGASARVAAAIDSASGPAWPGSDVARDQWTRSAHARGGIGCADCHQEGGRWLRDPGEAACRRCHQTAAKSFARGRHGMRAAQGLDPMSPATARLTMAAHAPAKVTCTSCHGAHEMSTADAAVTACLGCHADDHSRAYLGSPHHRAWQREVAGQAPPGTGVSCATCHMPRRVAYRDGLPEIVVTHNQSLTMRPREKMIRPVCGHCHGVAFSIDALADDGIIDGNFRIRPTHHIPSTEMAVNLDD